MHKSSLLKRGNDLSWVESLENFKLDETQHVNLIHIQSHYYIKRDRNSLT